jgi:hypothetical protein
MDTEDKRAWCAEAEKDEQEFVKIRLPQLNIRGVVNPEKFADPFTHDLTLITQADLKSVRTPLFKASEIYGIDPQYAVTFNVKDALRYRELYPNIIVVFDVRWDTLEWTDKHGTTYRVEPMHATFAGFLSDIRRAIMKGGNQVLSYQRRVDDKAGNAKHSYVFDVRELHRLG